MKKIMLSLMTLLLLCGCAESSTYKPDMNNPMEITDEQDGRSYSACRLLLLVEEETDDTQLKKLADRYGMSYLTMMGTIVLLESEQPFSAKDLAAIKAEIEKNDFVRSAEYDYIIKLDDPITPPMEDK
ncbi:MAG: hypothetical protein K6A14_04545 [Erysipelotrichaceae bacterium]|nr:hypothetical protein [Erysipelotrichaceae bacterium]